MLSFQRHSLEEVKERVREGVERHERGPYTADEQRSTAGGEAERNILQARGTILECIGERSDLNARRLLFGYSFIAPH